MKETMLTMDTVKQALGGLTVAIRGPESAAFRGGAIDSRRVADGDLFFALHGERADGHDFIAQAFGSGATGAVIGRPVEAGEDRTLIHVSDPLAALQRIATHSRSKRDLRVIGITGSVGKTTAKELIADVLSHRFNVLKTEANLNTEIGVPLTLLDLNDEHEIAVLELGMYVPGDIAMLAQISQPDVGVVMNVGPIHLERVGSIGRITAGKAELVEALPGDGLAALNGDDPRVAAMARRTRARSILFGLSEQCDIRATDLVSRGLDGFSFTLEVGGQSVSVACPLPGKHHVYAALAAAAMGINEGMSVSEIADALAAARIDFRLAVKRAVNGATIIDDSYNASPPSMIAALDLLSETPGRHLAVLGHMRELGAAELDGHLAVGRHAARTCDVLYVIGDDAEPLAVSAGAAGVRHLRRIGRAEDAAAVLRKELRNGDFCLIKASRAVGLESVVEALVEK